MEMILGNGFCEMSQKQMERINGGGWFNAVLAFGGTILVSATPVACVIGGPSAGAGLFSLGCAALDKACNK